MEIKDLNKGKKVVLAATMINIMTGMMYTWSIVSKALKDTYYWSSKQASLPYTIFTITFPIAMVIFASFQDKKGPRTTATLGCIMIGFGFILSGIFLNPFIMLVTIGVFVGMGVGIINIATLPTAIKWFHPSMKGKINGIVVSGVGLSAVFYSPLANLFIDSFGIPRTLIFIGLIVLIPTIGFSNVLSNPIQDYSFEDNKIKNTNRFSKDINWKQMIRSKEFYKIWLMFGLSSSAGLMIISHITNIADIQASWKVGFILVMIISGFNSLGRILGGVLSDALGRLEIMRYLFIVQVICMILFRYATNIPIMVICSAITGLCYGASFAVFPATIGDYYGNKNFGLNYGILFTSWGLGGLVGPMTGATIFDAFGNYNMAFIIGIFLLSICLFTTLTFRKDKIYK